MNVAGTSTSSSSTPLDHEACFLAHRATVYRWSLALGCDHQRALDAVQETFLRLLRADPLFPSAAAQIAWLRTVAARVIADLHRSRSRSPLPLTKDPRTSTSAHASPDEQQAIRDAIVGLSDMQRLVLLCKAVDDLTFSQIASDLSISVPTAKTHYVRALVAVRARLDPTQGTQS